MFKLATTDVERCTPKYEYRSREVTSQEGYSCSSVYRIALVQQYQVSGMIRSLSKEENQILTFIRRGYSNRYYGVLLQTNITASAAASPTYWVICRRT